MSGLSDLRITSGENTIGNCALGSDLTNTGAESLINLKLPQTCEEASMPFVVNLFHFFPVNFTVILAVSILCQVGVMDVYKKEHDIDFRVFNLVH